VSEEYKITNNFSVSLDMQSQPVAENVLSRASILLSNRIQSFFPLCNGFSNCLNGDLLPFVFDCLFHAL